MDTNTILSLRNGVVAAIGILFVVLTITEYTRLSGLRRDFKHLTEDLRAESYRAQRALHKVIAAYGIADPGRRIALLEEALRLDPLVFNAHNTIGYAYLSLGDIPRATHHFAEAVRVHPQDKAGYFDLAYAAWVSGDRALCLARLREAIRVDPSSREDLLAGRGPDFKDLDLSALLS